MITPAQTVGPYFSIGLPWPDGPDVVPDGTEARSGCAGACSTASASRSPTRWSRPGRPDPDGRYETPGFRGFGRCPTDEDGSWAIRTVKPGAVGGQAPHIAVSVFARGLLHHVVTRIYFADEDADANAARPRAERPRRGGAGDARRRAGGRRLPFRRAPPGSR